MWPERYLASEYREPVREVDDEQFGDLIWGAASSMKSKMLTWLQSMRKKIKKVDQAKEGTDDPEANNPSYLEEEAVKTIIPKDAIPGVKVGRSKRDAFRVASADVLPNLRQAELKGAGALT